MQGYGSRDRITKKVHNSILFSIESEHDTL